MTLARPASAPLVPAPAPGRSGPLRTLRLRLRPPVTITEPPPDVIVERDVEVPMRDGVRLRVNVFRPAGAGRYPVLACAHPYGKDRLPRRRGPVTIADRSSST